MNDNDMTLTEVLDVIESYYPKFRALAEQPDNYTTKIAFYKEMIEVVKATEFPAPDSRDLIVEHLEVRLSALRIKENCEAFLKLFRSN